MAAYGWPSDGIRRVTPFQQNHPWRTDAVQVTTIARMIAVRRHRARQMILTLTMTSYDPPTDRRPTGRGVHRTTQYRILPHSSTGSSKTRCRPPDHSDHRNPNRNSSRTPDGATLDHDGARPSHCMERWESSLTRPHIHFFDLTNRPAPIKLDPVTARNEPTTAPAR